LELSHVYQGCAETERIEGLKKLFPVIRRHFFPALLSASTGLAFSALFFLADARADYIPPGEILVHTKAYTPQNISFPLGTYEYSVDWQGIPVGRASISVKNSVLPVADNPQQDCFVVTAKANSGRVISLFYNLKHKSVSTFRADKLSPLSFYSIQTENSKSKSRQVRFDNDGEIHAELWKQGKDTPEEVIDFRSENTTFDPITAAFLARSLPVHLNEDFTFDVFNGKHRFLITLRVLRKEMVDVAGGQREAFVVVPTVKKLTDSEGEKRLRQATLWISTDPSREVLKIKSEVYIGSVNAELERFIPEPSLPATTARASLKTPRAEIESSSSEAPADASKLSKP